MFPVNLWEQQRTKPSDKRDYTNEKIKKKDTVNAARIYLASLENAESRRAMYYALKLIADLEGCTLDSIAWHRLSYANATAIRSRLAEIYSPATVNKALVALRQTLRAAWRNNLMNVDDYLKASDIKNVKFSRLLSGRVLSPGEIAALFKACADGTPAGSRDAAAFTLLYGCGLRRSEAISVSIDNYDSEAGQITIIGKHNRQRSLYISNGGQCALDMWISMRGDCEGSLLCPIDKAGNIKMGNSMTAQALWVRLNKRAEQANIQKCSPHDLRRTFITESLELNVDIITLQRIVGHQSPVTTAMYDMRPEEAKKKAAQLINVPFAG